MTTRWLGLALLLLVGGITYPAGATAHEATPAPAEILALPAMAIQPYDLPAGYGVRQGISIQPDDFGSDYWHAEYLLLLALPDPADPDRYARHITSSVTHYVEIDGAAGQIALIREDSASAGNDETEGSITVAGSASNSLVEGTRVIGDDSIITRFSGTGVVSGEPYSGLEITVRVENLVARIDVQDNTGVEPAVDEVEALAQIMVDRMAAVRGAGNPVLSAKLLQLTTGNDFVLDYESLEVPLQLDGQTARLIQDTDESLQYRAGFWAQHGVVDLYQNEQYLQPNGTTRLLDQLAYLSRIYRFGSEEAAAAFVETAAEAIVADPGHLINVQTIDVSGFDGTTRAISYDAPLDEQSTASGIRIWTQVDTVVVSVDAELAGGVALKGVQKLTAAQVACLEEDQRCPAMKVPDSLLNE